jgi:PUA domain protein
VKVGYGLVYKRRYFLRAKESKRWLREIAEEENIELTKFLKMRFEVVELADDSHLFLINGKPSFVKSEELFPTLKNTYVLNQLPSITVDMGAVPYICNGADVMAPGIVKVDGMFKADALVVILDEKFAKHIAVCKVLYDSSIIPEKKQGKIAQNLHYINDKFWETFKQI